MSVCVLNDIVWEQEPIQNTKALYILYTHFLKVILNKNFLIYLHFDCDLSHESKHNTFHL